MDWEEGEGEVYSQAVGGVDCRAVGRRACEGGFLGTVPVRV